MSIKTDGNYYCLMTKNTSYAFRVTEYGDLEHLYYGSKIPFEDLKILSPKKSALLVNTLYPEGDVSYGIDSKNFEYSFACRGDSRSSAAYLTEERGGVFDFVFERAETGEIPADFLTPLPKRMTDSLCVTMKDNAHEGLKLRLWYLVYGECDAIVRFTEFQNGFGETIEIRKAASMQLDLEAAGKQLLTFEGAWGRERKPRVTPLDGGKTTAGSFSGMSGAECNPFFILKDGAATQNEGDAYGFNLFYSGSHELSAEVTPYGGLRILQGVQSEGFCYRLKAEETFWTPAAVETFSGRGLNGVSQNMHAFISHCVAPEKKIPVALNSWEACYFDLNEKKLLKLADEAADLGFECLVADDGWFGKRVDDTTSLGDWTENRIKFPRGLRFLSEYLQKKGMTLGLWAEPEMISEQSELFRTHPEWVLKDAKARPIVGRNQYILDLTLPEVQNFIVETVERIVTEYGAGYLKWDFNRRFAEIRGAEGSGYFYRYVRGLYATLKRVTERFPELVLENCASGGGRFDLGAACFFALHWTSDNTDPFARSEIQDGAFYGYPPVVSVNHISASPNHQTKRASSFAARRDVAYFGALGVQADVAALGKDEKSELKSAVKDYKKDRELLKDAKFYRLAEFGDPDTVWFLFSEREECGILCLYHRRFETVSPLPVIRFRGLQDYCRYRVFGNGVDVAASGAALRNAGLRLPQNFQGAGGDAALSLTDGCTLFLRVERAPDAEEGKMRND